MKKAATVFFVLVATCNATGIAEAGLFARLFRTRCCAGKVFTQRGNKRHTATSGASKCQNGTCRKPQGEKAEVVGP